MGCDLADAGRVKFSEMRISPSSVLHITRLKKCILVSVSQSFGSSSCYLQAIILNRTRSLSFCIGQRFAMQPDQSQLEQTNCLELFL